MNVGNGRMKFGRTCSERQIKPGFADVATDGRGAFTTASWNVIDLQSSRFPLRFGGV